MLIAPSEMPIENGAEFRPGYLVKMSQIAPRRCVDFPDTFSPERFRRHFNERGGGTTLPIARTSIMPVEARNIPAQFAEDGRKMLLLVAAASGLL